MILLTISAASENFYVVAFPQTTEHQILIDQSVGAV